MAKGTRGRRGFASRQCRSAPYPLPSNNKTEDMHPKTCSKISAKKDWEDATCSVCMECPHNAVLLLCSSYDKGCRPYMCGTSIRYSNCLDQYKKAYTKLSSSENHPLQDALDDQALQDSLACPLCRGQVKGWTVVEPAREHLNSKRRSCMHDNCLFIGTYRELRKHVKAEHPSAKPREVDPCLEQKWTRMERERERDDVISTIRSSMPGAVFFGDYVIEGGRFGIDSDEEDGFDADAMLRNEGIEVGGGDRNLMSVFLFLQAFGSAGNLGSHRGIRPAGRDFSHTLGRGGRRLNGENPNAGYSIQGSSEDGDGDGDGDTNDNSASAAGLLRQHGRAFVGRSGRRRQTHSHE